MYLEPDISIVGLLSLAVSAQYLEPDISIGRSLVISYILELSIWSIINVWPEIHYYCLKIVSDYKIAVLTMCVFLFILKVFNRFLRSFNLPVGTQAVQVGRTNGGYDIGPTLTWIVSMVVSKTLWTMPCLISASFFLMTALLVPTLLGMM